MANKSSNITSSKNPFMNDIDDYINTFHLKNFEDSDDEDIFSTKTKLKTNVEKSIKIDQKPSQNSIPVINVESKENEGNRSIITPPTIKNKIPTATVNEPAIDLFESNSSMQEFQESPQKKINQGNTNVKSAPFKNIVKDYNNVFKRKVDIFSNDALEYEINKINKAEEDFEIVNLNNETNNLYIPKDSESSIQEKHDFYVNKQENNLNTDDDSIKAKNIYSPVPKKNEIVGNNKFDVDLPSNYQMTKKAIFNQGRLIIPNILNSNYSNKNNIKILPISEIEKQVQDKDKVVENEYFPINYSEAFTSTNKAAINHIKTRMESKDIIIANGTEYILIYLLNYFIENNFNSTFLDMSNLSKRKDLISHLKKLKLLNKENQASSSNKPTFKLNEEVQPVNPTIGNIIDKGLERLLVECYNEKSPANFFFFSIFGRKEDLFNYISTIFEENPKYKEDDLYILFMIKSGNISQLMKEKKDYLYSNFFSILCLLIQNYEYFDDVNVSLFLKQLNDSESNYKALDVHFILCILNNAFTFTSNNASNYTNMITSYLHFPSYSRLAIADLYNYIFYKRMKDNETYKFSALAFCSILIKFKYFCIKRESGQVDKLKEYGKRILENVHQFGNIGKNELFQEFLKSFLGNESDFRVNNNKTQASLPQIKQSIFEENHHDNKKLKTEHTIPNTTINEPISKEKSPSVENIQTPPKISIFDSDEKENKKVEEKPVKNIQQQNKVGIGSFLINALGFGSNRPVTPKKTDIQKSHTEKTDENTNLEKKNEEAPEMYYDPQKKRWVLRGRIYDDDSNEQKEENTNNTISSTPTTILPPKIKEKDIRPPKFNAPKFNEKASAAGNVSNTGEAGTNISTTNTSQTSIPQTNKISNPFSVKKETNPKPPTLSVNKPPQKPNLTNRYTSIIDYSNNQ